MASRTTPQSTMATNQPRNPSNMQSIVQPAPLDVLCGKSKLCVHHPGSKRFRAIIDAHCQKYLESETKYDKMSLTREVYDNISKTSRFLKLVDEEANVWEELTPTAARDKIGHSLRFASRPKKRRRKNHKRTPSSISQSESTSTTESSTDSSSCAALSSRGQGPHPGFCGPNVSIPITSATDDNKTNPLPLTSVANAIQIGTNHLHPPLPPIPQSLNDEFDDLIESLDLDVGDPNMYSIVNNSACLSGPIPIPSQPPRGQHQHQHQHQHNVSSSAPFHPQNHTVN